MEPEGSSPYSQEPPTGPCRDPDQSIPYRPSYLSKIHGIHNEFYLTILCIMR
jgi:hypothetical protein